MNSDLYRSTLARAADRWPELAASEAQFRAHLDELAVDDDALAKQGMNLALTFACTLGSRAAMAEVDQELRRQASAARRRFRMDEAAFADVVQDICERLFAARPPRILAYRGQGPLGAWLRVTVVRALLDHVRRCRPEGNDHPIDAVPGEETGPDSALDGLRQGPRLLACLASALAALSPADRLLFKLHFSDGVSLDRLASLNAVHRTTIARRIVTVRHQVARAVSDQMGTRFGMRPSEFRSMWRTVGPKVRLTLSSLFEG